MHQGNLLAKLRKQWNASSIIDTLTPQNEVCSIALNYNPQITLKTFDQTGLSRPSIKSREPSISKSDYRVN